MIDHGSKCQGDPCTCGAKQIITARRTVNGTPLTKSGMVIHYSNAQLAEEQALRNQDGSMADDPVDQGA